MKVQWQVIGMGIFFFIGLGLAILASSSGSMTFAGHSCRVVNAEGMLTPSTAESGEIDRAYQSPSRHIQLPRRLSFHSAHGDDRSDYRSMRNCK